MLGSILLGVSARASSFWFAAAVLLVGAAPLGVQAQSARDLGSPVGDPSATRAPQATAFDARSACRLLVVLFACAGLLSPVAEATRVQPSVLVLFALLVVLGRRRDAEHAALRECPAATVA